MNLTIRYSTNMIAAYIANFRMTFKSHPRKVIKIGSSILKAMMITIRIIRYLTIVCVKSFIRL